MEFSIYSQGERVKFLEKRLKEMGYEIGHKTWLIGSEYALQIQVESLEEAKDLCDKLGLDKDIIKLTVSEL